MSRTVLLVEDDTELLDAYGMVFEDLGYQVTSFVDGAPAIRYLQEARPPALVLLDWVLPNCTGDEFLRRMRSIDGLGEVPVVVVTSRKRAPDEWREEGLTPENCLRKPIQLIDLLDVLSRCSAQA